MAKMTRYSLYYRLMDVSFGAGLIALASFSFRAITGEGIWGYVDLPFRPSDILIPTAVLLPSLLIFQRWMRDDFSEILWQKSAGTVLKLLVILPIPLMFVIAVTIGSRVMLGLDAATAYTSDSDLGLPPVLEGQLIGFIWSMLTLWLVSPVLFTFAFQWHRWRASR
jgi:hypothetical protein